jgi:hypothetical protein
MGGAGWDTRATSGKWGHSAAIPIPIPRVSNRVMFLECNERVLRLYVSVPLSNKAFHCRELW